jgi:hypothetical protein
MGAVAAHYYAIFVVAPFAAAEAYRSWRQRSLRLSALLPMLAALVPLVIAAPLIANAGRVDHAFWVKVSWHSIPEAYTQLLGQHVVTALAIAGLVAICFLITRGVPRTTEQQLWPPPLHEMLCVACFALLPFLVVPIAMLTTGAFVGRYVIATIIGVSILITWGLYLFTAYRPAVIRVLLAAVLLGAVASSYPKYRGFTNERQEMFSWADRLAESEPRSLPIVIEDPHVFFQLSHYAPPRTARRITYLADVSLARKHTGTDSADFEMAIIGVASGARVSAFETFLESTSHLLVYGYPSYFGWLVAEMASRHVETRITGELDGRLLLLVENERPQKRAALYPIR